MITDGAFTPDGTFLCLPRIDNGWLFTTWQNKVFELFPARGKIDQETVDQMRSWPHSGFSVDDSVYLLPGDTAGLQRLAEYILRCPFSLAGVVRLTDDGSVIYRALSLPKTPSAFPANELARLRHCGRNAMIAGFRGRSWWGYACIQGGVLDFASVGDGAPITRHAMDLPL